MLLRKRALLSLLLALMIGLVSGCGANEQGNSSQERAAVSPEQSMPAENKSPEAQYDTGAPGVTATQGYSTATEGYKKSAEGRGGEFERKIIKRAQIEQVVTELEPAMKKVEELVDRSKGYIQSSSVHQKDREREARYVIRVPHESFASILEEFRGIGENTFISQQGEDVTQEYYDNEARIKNLKLQEAAVQKLLDRADKMEDILKIQQELFRIRGEIEMLEGRNRYLDHLSSLSTIELGIREVKPLEFVNDDTDSLWNRSKEGFMDSLQWVYSFFINILVFVISLLPVLIFLVLPVGLLAWAAIRYQRLRTKKHEQALQAKIAAREKTESGENKEDR